MIRANSPCHLVTLSARHRRALTTRGLVLSVTAAILLAGAATGGYFYYRANSPSQLAARAQLALEQHDPLKAIELLQRALSRGGKGGDTAVSLRNIMARAMIDAGRESDARDYASQALTIKPDNAEALDL